MAETPETKKIEKNVKEIAREAEKALRDKKIDEREAADLRLKARAVLDFTDAKDLSLEEACERYVAVGKAIETVAREQKITEREIYEWIFGQEQVQKFLDMSVDQVVAAKDAHPLLRKLAMETLARSRPETILEAAYGIKERWYGATVIIKAAEQHPYAALEFADRYKDQPYAKEVIVKAAEQHPYTALEFADRYKDQPYAKAVIVKAAEQHPGAALEFADQYKDQPYAREVIVKAAERNPYVALRFADRYKDQPYAREVIEKATEQYHYYALQFVDRYKDQPYAKEVIVKAAERDPYMALQFADRYKDQPYAKEVIVKAAERDPYAALEFADRYKDQPYAREVIEKAAERDPYAALKSADRYKDQPYAREVIEKAARQAAERRPVAALRFADLYKNQPYAREVIEKAAERDPYAALKFADRYKDQPYAREVIIKAAKRDPDTALELYKNVADILDNDKSRTIQKLRELRQTSFLNQKRMAALLHALTYEGMSFQEADNITKNPSRYLHELIRLKGIPNVVGSYAIEELLRPEILQIIQEVNARHNLPDQRRFEIVRESDAVTLYTMLVYGEEEVFTSSFNGFFRRMLDRMKQENLSGNELFNRVGYNKFRTFIKLCVSFNRLGEFLETMKSEERQKILERFIGSLEDKPDSLEQATAIAETFATLRDPALLAVLQKNLHKEYERVKQKGDKKGMKLYGLLAGMFGKNVMVDRDWYGDMAAKYHIENVTQLPTNELFNPDGSNIQHHFFYDDPDGHASFDHFVRHYRGRREWQLEEKDTYVRITRKGSGGKSIEIYANKPAHEDEGRKAIEEILTKRGIERIVLVHRGHSYHAARTIEHITPRARIVVLGSCGGYNNVSAVLERSPQAHILSTKGTGAMGVNDPLLRIINESIVVGQDIDWPSLWERAEKNLGSNPDFKNYIPPHRNLGVMFLKAYRALVFL